MLRPRTMIAGWLAAALACAVGCSGIPRPDPGPAAPPVTTSGGNTVVVSTPAQPCCKTSIWDILGVPQMAKAGAFVIRRVRSRLGTRYPGLEPQPELLPIADPANLESPYPSVAAAAEVKAEQDAAPQKIKAIAYLATLGCTACYPDIEKAFLASLDDCNEEVRYATVVALRETNGSPCKACKSSSCCNPAILRKLEKIAFDTNDEGCFVEPSPRVRRMARLAFRGCGNAVPAEPAPEVIEGPSPADVEGPAPVPAPLPAAPPPAPAPAAPPPLAANSPQPAPGRELRSVLVAAVEALPAVPPDGVLAGVNGESIHYRDLAPEVEARLAVARRSGAPAPSRQAVLRQVLSDAIDRKLLCHDAWRNNFPEAVALVSYEGPDPQRERRLAEQWLRACIPVDERIDPQEVWSYYRRNLAKFQRPGQVRFESITAAFAEYASREDARHAIAHLRNDALGNREESPPRGVQKAVAQTHDWTDADALPSAAVRQTLFAMPVGSISQILETADGFLVVRLLERRGPAALSLEQATEEIRTQLIAERRAQAARGYLETLRQNAQLWSAF